MREQTIARKLEPISSVSYDLKTKKGFQLLQAIHSFLMSEETDSLQRKNVFNSREYQSKVLMKSQSSNA